MVSEGGKGLIVQIYACSNDSIFDAFSWEHKIPGGKQQTQSMVIVTIPMTQIEFPEVRVVAKDVC